MQWQKFWALLKGLPDLNSRTLGAIGVLISMTVLIALGHNGVFNTVLIGAAAYLMGWQTGQKPPTGRRRG